MTILVTGGAGYIGSHAVQRLLRDGRRVVALDNLFRGHAAAIDRLIPTAGGRLTFVQGDVGDRELVGHLLKKHAVEQVMHFAALAYVGESVTEPLRYYRANTAAALALIEASDEAGVKRFVFSSTCASYGEPDRSRIPIAESCPQSPINPYGWSKFATEKILLDYAAQAARAGKDFGLAILRYFNVAGSDRTGVLGEHHEPETHLIPVCLQVQLGQRDALTIFGTDYSTPDGTCIRDYIHVEDLVDVHVAVLGKLAPSETRIYNLGIGKGFSVRQIIAAVERVTGKKLPVKEGARRPGDPPELYADPRKIRDELGWTAKITDLDEIVSSAWAWYIKNPHGYRAG